MQKIFLHIGTFKTGSTALQFHMHQNEARLLENGFYYGNYFNNYYVHSNLCYGLLREALINYGLFSKYENHPRFLNVAENPDIVIKRMKEKMAKDLNLIISSEAFFADAFRTMVGLKTQLQAQQKREINNYMRTRLKELLLDITDNITIVCYLRRQDLFIESQYNQYCKNQWYSDLGNGLPEFKEFVEYYPVELDYYTVLEEWKSIFDKAVFVIKPYEKESFNDNLITDFYTDILHIDINEVKKFGGIHKAQTNPKLDRDVLEYIRRLDFNDEKVTGLLRKYSDQLDRVKEYAYFSERERKEFLQGFMTQNAMVAKKFLNRTDGCLFKNMNYYIPEYGGLKISRVFEITHWVIDEMCKMNENPNLPNCVRENGVSGRV